MAGETWGFIGAGAITEAIVTGMIRTGHLPGRVLISRRNTVVSTRLAQLSGIVEVVTDNQRIADLSDLLFLAVRPQVAEEVLSPLTFRPGQEIASLIATVSIDRISRLVGPAGPVTRTVPVPAVALARGLTLLSDHSARLEALFEALGGVVVAEDAAEFDALSLPSTMMGLFFGLQEILSACMIAQGSSPKAARHYLAWLFAELSRTGSNETAPFAALRAAHSTPGGLNEALYQEFLKAGGDKALTKAVRHVAWMLKSGTIPSDAAPGHSRDHTSKN